MITGDATVMDREIHFSSSFQVGWIREVNRHQPFARNRLANPPPPKATASKNRLQLRNACANLPNMMTVEERVKSL